MSLLTMTRSGQPARIRKVACRLRSRAVTCWPTCWADVEIPLPALLITSPPELRVPASCAAAAPTENTVESAMPRASCQK